MEKAKAAVSDFLSRAGHHDTTVTETVAPAVVEENLTAAQRIERQKIIDKEVHQDHFHTTVQPVKDREVLPEEHTHRMGTVEERERHLGNEAEIKARLEREAAQFRSTRTEGEMRETSTTLPTLGGEHIHHHVHETIQPVVQKEIIQPSVVHSTIPVHEVVHNAAQHHGTSALPAVSMADFKRQGGVLGGREERHDHFEGEPKGVAGALGAGAGATGNVTSSHHDTAGPHRSNLANKADPRVDSDLDGSRNAGLAENNTTGTGYGTSGTTGTTGSNTAGPHRSDLANKADPRVDSDLDGSRNAGLAQNTTTGTGYGSSSTGYGISGTTGTTGTTGGQTTAGPHSSDLGNKMDPRVDSDLDGSRNMGAASNTTGIDNTTTGTAGSTTKPSLLDRMNPMKDTSSSSRV